MEFSLRLAQKPERPARRWKVDGASPSPWELVVCPTPCRVGDAATRHFAPVAINDGSLLGMNSRSYIKTAVAVTGGFQS